MTRPICFYCAESYVEFMFTHIWCNNCGQNVCDRCIVHEMRREGEITHRICHDCLMELSEMQDD